MYKEMAIVFSLLSFVLTGCSTKEERALLKTYEQKIQTHKKLLQTEKIQFNDGNETKVLLTATYLFQQVDIPRHEDQRDEVFIVGLYMEDTTIRNLHEDDFNLTLNGHSAKRITRLAKSDKRLKNIPLVIEWGEYFEVAFPHVKGVKFNLLFNSRKYGKRNLEFAKKAKYTFTKELI
jgi:hypothetical protein